MTAPAAAAESRRIEFSARRDVEVLLRILAAAGAAVFVTGVFLRPERAWANLLVAAFYFLGLGTSALFFIAVMHLARASWSTAFRRVPEAMAMSIPVGAVLMGLVLLGSTRIYEWTHADLVAGSPLLAAKSGWLNLPFFTVRAVIYLAVWIFFALAIVSASRAQDADGGAAQGRRAVKLSAVFMVAFAVTFLGASFDWLMSVQPEWYSTIFGWYSFAGSFAGGLAAMTVIVVVLRRTTPLRHVITEHHLHDLGKCCFAFSTFWAYLWFCQYMLIWYANLPEETSFYLKQMSGGWMSLFLLNFGLNWIIPFVTLLPRAAKRSEGVLLKVCTVMLIGRWLDLYLTVMPAKSGGTPPFGIWEIGIFLGVAALFAAWVFRSLGQADLIPSGDPTLERSLHHHA